MNSHLLFTASSEVQHFQSSLATVGRKHLCRGELLTLTCEVVGSRLDWRAESNVIHQARYFDTNRVDEVHTVNGPSIQFRTILTGNEATGTVGVRRLTSILIAKLSSSYMSPHNISCSSDSETWLLQFQIAGKEHTSLRCSCRNNIITCH